MSRRLKTNVIDSTTSLIGRVAERAAIAACFDGGARLITIVGAGGMGKTRVATRFAAEHAADFADHGAGGAWFCDLTEARDLAAMDAAVAAALGLPRARARDLGASIARKQRVLIVLDNLEHLVADAPATIGSWLRCAPHAQFLVTSRVALGLPEEQIWPLAPLDDAAAVELFLARARLLRPDLPSSAGDAAVIAAIVRRLEGVPLAIELAAARVRALSLEQLRDRLEQPLELLVRPRDLGRHGSMRRTILDSVDSLAPDARACFAECASFRGGFTLEAALEVLAAPGRDVLTTLEVLCEHSLLRCDASTPRFQLYETIREVAAELLLDAGDVRRGELAARHARYFARAGRALAAAATASADHTVLARLGREVDNLLQAHATALGLGGDLAGSLALALDPLLATRSQHRLRLQLLDAALALAATPGAVVEHSATLIARAQAYRELGHFDRARVDLLRARELAGAGAPAHEALAIARLGELIEIGGDTEAARRSFETAIEVVHGAPPDPFIRVVEAEIHARLGHALRREGKLAEAAIAIERASARYRDAAHQEGRAAMAYEAAVIAVFQRRLPEARLQLDAALAIARELDAPQLEAAVSSVRGILAQELGALDEAIRHHVAAVQVFRDLGNRHREGSALFYLAGAYLERGEPAQAIPILEQAAAAAQVVGAVRYHALIAGARAAAYASLGDRAEADRALAACARATEDCQSEPGLRATLAIHRLHLASDPDPGATARAIAAATPGDDPQLALRILEARLAATTPATTAMLVVRADTAGFRTPGATRDTDLSRRWSLRRLFEALVQRRLAAPGDPVTLAELVEAGWPDERMRHEAANNRLHVALTTLRKLGLRPLLISGERGYLLDPSVAIRVERGSASATD